VRLPDGRGIPPPEQDQIAQPTGRRGAVPGCGEGLQRRRQDLDGDEVLRHLSLNIPDWYGDSSQRDLAIELAGYLAEQLKTLRPDEASAARVLREMVLNQRAG